jgi:hypothetical protein
VKHGFNDLGAPGLDCEIWDDSFSNDQDTWQASYRDGFAWNGSFYLGVVWLSMGVLERIKKRALFWLK